MWPEDRPVVTPRLEHEEKLYGELVEAILGPNSYDPWNDSHIKILNKIKLQKAQDKEKELTLKEKAFLIQCIREHMRPTGGNRDFAEEHLFNILLNKLR